jgi:MFS transporter, DHA2 family, multidrug resistance protein
VSPAQLSEKQKILLFAMMALGQFMALLDIQIVAASISKIQAGLAASPDEVSWVQTAYLMAEIVMIPLSGWLSKAASTRWVFVGSAAGFTLASAACGFAQNLPTMIVARTLQGFLGGAMIPTAFATGFALFQGKKQALVPAILGILGTFAPTIGPTLGGFITTHLSWQWLFFINLVPGVAITLGVSALGRIDDPNPQLLKGFDLLGLVLLVVSLSGLEYVLEEGYRYNWFDDPTICGCAWVTAGASILFVWRCLTYSNPIVELRVLGNRQFAVACIFNTVTGFGLFSAVYILPLFLGRERAFNAQQIGNAVFVAGLSMVVSTPLTAAFSRRVDSRILLFTGFSLFALALWLMSFITSDWTGDELFWPQIIRGFAIMFCVVPATNMALGSVPPVRLKAASAVFSTTRNLGGALGIATVNTLLNDRTNQHWHRLTEGITSADPRISAALDAVAARVASFTSDPAFIRSEALATLARGVRVQAATMAYADALWLISMVFACALALVPLVKGQARPKDASSAAAAH